MPDTLVRVEHVSKKFCRNLRRSLWYGVRDLGNELVGRQRNHETLRQDEFWAVDDVSFELKRGECLGLIGHNGAGKTTLLRMLNGLITPDRGRITMRGRVGALIALGAGFNPLLSGRENIYVNAAVLGFSKMETDRKFDEIVAFSGLEEFVDSPVQHYSSGMYVRLGFSVAAHLEPDVLLVDEALAVGDLPFIIKCLNRIAALRKAGTGVIFVSHSELQVREATNDCLLMHHGRVATRASPDTVFHAYGDLHTTDEGDAGFVFDGPITVSLRKDADGAPIEGRTGEPLALAFEFDVRQPVTNGIFELRFWDNRGQLVSTLRSDASGVSFDFARSGQEIVVSIHRLPLSAGKYRLAAGVRKQGGVVGWSRDVGFLQVSRPIERWLGDGIVPMQADLHGPSSSEIDS